MKKERENEMLKRPFLRITAVILFLAVLTGCSLSQVKIKAPLRGNKIEFAIMKELDKFKSKINKNLRITVGGFSDKTGQFKDSLRSQYSKAVTQGGIDILYHMLYTAFGPNVVVERETVNWRRMAEEYRYSLGKQGIRTGLITKAGPEGGVIGAQYMVTGAVVYYHVDLYSGGGGFNIDGYGAHFKASTASVAVELRLVDMSTSEICWSTLIESWVTGIEIGADLYSFITASGNEHVVSAEAGFAYQLPADYAFQIDLANAVVDMIKENKKVFFAGLPSTDSQNLP
jgi:curli biogenesis system outer membrane secretion channel CsgG